MAGMPDMPAFAHQPRYRRTGNALRIDTNEWVHLMSRRVEASVSRDWTFGLVFWNYLCRSFVNRTRSIYAYERNNGKSTAAKFTSQYLEKGAIKVAHALWGKHTDVNGKPKPVSGDMTKVRYVPGLSAEA